MTGVLLDLNVLLALAWPNHQLHAAAVRWFVGLTDRPWSTCATTQLGFVRLSSNPAFTPAARTPAEARDLLVRLILARPGHHLLSEPPEPTSAAFGELLVTLRGPKQVTDAWLLHVARHNGVRLASFDRRLLGWAPAGLVDPIEVGG